MAWHAFRRIGSARRITGCTLAAAVVASVLVPSPTALASASPWQPPISKTVTSFRGPGDDVGRAVVRQPDGKAYSAGTIGGDFGVLRNAPGVHADLSFGVDGWATTDFGGYDGANAVQVDSSGRVVAAGWTDGDIAVARYNAAGRLDRSFGVDGQVVTNLGGSDDAAYEVGIDAAGRVVVAAGNRSAMVLLRFLDDGSLDPAFGHGGLVRIPSEGPGRSLSFTGGGRTVIAGGGGPAGFHLAVIGPDGAPDPGFGSNGAVRISLGAPAWAVGVAALADGRFVVAGERDGDLALLRMEPSGALDASFGSGGVVMTDLGRVEHPHGVSFAPDGAAFIAGESGPRWGFVASYLPTGALNLQFGGTGWVQEEGPEWWDTAAAPNGGWTTVGTWGLEFSTKYWNSVGGTLLIDTYSGGPKMTDRAAAAVHLPDGRWVVLADTGGMIGLVRYRADGTVDPTFGRNGRVTSDLLFYPRALAVQSNGRIIVAGNLDDLPGIVAFRSDGSLDRAWGTDAGRTTVDSGGGRSTVGSPPQLAQALAVLAGDGIAMLGVDPRGAFHAHLLANGQLDRSYGNGGLLVAAFPDWGSVYGRVTARQPDGKTLLVAGALTVRRYNVDGTLDTGFANLGTLTLPSPTFWAGGSVNAIAVLPNGKILIGDRTWFGGFRLAIARFNPDGTIDKSFPPVRTELKYSNDPTRHIGSAAVHDFVLLPDGRFLAVADEAIARYLPTGALDVTFGDRGIILLAPSPRDGDRAINVIESAVAADGVITQIGTTNATAHSHGVVISRYAGSRPGPSGLRAWGFNGLGNLGTGGRVDRPSAVAVATLTNTVDVSAGVFHSLALRADGTVWAWGWNGVGQLGDGTTVDRDMPVQVAGLTDVMEVSAGAYHSLALKRDGTVWAWGWNALGQLGDGTTINRLTPVRAALPADVTSIAAGGFHSLAVLGTVWAWGWNASGQLGDGTTIDRHRPVPLDLSDELDGQVAVAAGTYHSLLLRTGGRLYAWGSNLTGQLGNGTTQDSLRASPVAAGTGFVSLSGGGLHTLARHSDGSVWAWGWNGVGQLGDGTTVDRHVPTRLPGLTAVDVAAGIFHSAAVTGAGVVATWGWNAYGQLGTGATVDRWTPTAVATSPAAVVVAAGAFHTVAR